jgi:hypothetical protein
MAEVTFGMATPSSGELLELPSLKLIWLYLNMVLFSGPSEKYGEGIFENSMWILYISWEIYMFVVAFVLLFKFLALCVKKRHLQDCELEFEYLWYVLLKVARRKRNAKISIVGLALGRDHLIVDYMVLKF